MQRHLQLAFFFFLLFRPTLSLPAWFVLGKAAPEPPHDLSAPKAHVPSASSLLWGREHGENQEQCVAMRLQIIQHDLATVPIH